MQTFTLNIPEEILPVILTSVVDIHGLKSTPEIVDEEGVVIQIAYNQTPEERAKELVVQFLGDIVVQYQQRQALLAVPKLDLSSIE